MAIFAVALIMGAVLIGSCSAQENTNYLKVKGVVLNDYKTDVTVYIQNEITNEWNEITTKKDKSKYSLRLSTDNNYKIVFMGNSGDIKTIYIKSGDPGMYFEYLDIDFTNKEKYACMYQTENERYYIQTKIEYEGIASLEQNNRIRELNGSLVINFKT